MEPVLLSTAYLPPAAWVSLCLGREVILEAHEHYVKQTIRNRASICGANGRVDLVIPVSHEGLQHQPIREVRIANDPGWRRVHWKSIQSAYGKAPYFEYYSDNLRLAFHQEKEFLFDWNLSLLQCVFQLLGPEFRPVLTPGYEAVPQPPIFDSRQPATWPTGPGPYRQVFMPRLPFLPGLSVLDLLFNHGKQSVEMLQMLSKSP